MLFGSGLLFLVGCIGSDEPTGPMGLGGGEGAPPGPAGVGFAGAPTGVVNAGMPGGGGATGQSALPMEAGVPTSTPSDGGTGAPPEDAGSDASASLDATVDAGP